MSVDGDWLAAAPDEVKALPEYSTLQVAVSKILHPLPIMSMDSWDGSMGINKNSFYGDWYAWPDPTTRFNPPLASTGFIKVTGTYTISLTGPVKEFAITTNNAILTVQQVTLDGQVPIVSGVIDTSTDYERGHQSVVSVWKGTSMVLRFPNPGQVISFQVSHVAGAGVLNICSLKTDPALLDDGQRPTLEGDSGVCFKSEDFNDVLSMQKQLYGVDFYKQLSSVTDTHGKWMEATLNPLTNGIFDSKIALPVDANEVALEYDVMFMEDFRDGLTDACKFPGFRSASGPDDGHWMGLAGAPIGTYGTLLNGNGGNPANGYTGWSARGHTYIPFPDSHPHAKACRNGSYVYHALQKIQYGDVCKWDQAGSGLMPPEVCHRIYQRLKVNTPGIPDGSIESRINGVLQSQRGGFLFRYPAPYTILDSYGVHTNLGCRSIWFLMYHGGTLKPKGPGHVRFRNIKVKVIS